MEPNRGLTAPPVVDGFCRLVPGSIGAVAIQVASEQDLSVPARIRRRTGYERTKSSTG